MKKCKVIRLNVTHFGLLTLLLIITVLSLSSNVQARDKLYPGKLIEIGSHRLHIHCVGEGSPSVIIDSGIGGLYLEWSKIQNNLSNDVKVCSYDRAGYGWSDLGPRPRTTTRITRELKALLLEAKIPGPYILVGHSFGGYNIRYFASEYPELVAGLVLIDSSHPEQFNTEEFKRVEAKTLVKHKNSIRKRIIHPIVVDNYPKEKKRLAYQLMSTLKSKRTIMDESDYMEISAKQVATRSHHHPYYFPVVIITRGKRVWPDNDLGNRQEQQWFALQDDLENIGVKPDHFMAHNSGHVIHLDQPEFVSKNILLAVNKARLQILEDELISKFNIRQKNNFILSPLVAKQTSYELNTINFDEYSFVKDPFQQLMHDPTMLYLRNRKPFSEFTQE